MDVKVEYDQTERSQGTTRIRRVVQNPKGQRVIVPHSKVRERVRCRERKVETIRHVDREMRVEREVDLETDLFPLFSSCGFSSQVRKRWGIKNPMWVLPLIFFRAKKRSWFSSLSVSPSFSLPRNKNQLVRWGPQLVQKCPHHFFCSEWFFYSDSNSLIRPSPMINPVSSSSNISPHRNKRRKRCI